MQSPPPPAQIGHPGFRQQKDVMHSKCPSLRRTKAFPQAPSRLLLTTHWPQLGHKAASTFKRGWAANYFALPDSSWPGWEEGGWDGNWVSQSMGSARPDSYASKKLGWTLLPEDQWTERDRGKSGTRNIKGVINASQTRVKAVHYDLCLSFLCDLASPEGHSIHHQV